LRSEINVGVCVSFVFTSYFRLCVPRNFRKIW